MLNSTVVRILTLVSGVLAIVLPNVHNFGLPTDAQSVITGIGGTLLLVLALLEHPTTKTAAGGSSGNQPTH
jgi:hypothetical protein